jgi:hypothetical protein
LRAASTCAGVRHVDVSTLAFKHLRIEIAAPRVFEDPVFDAIESIARVESRIVNQRVFRGRNIARPGLMHCLRDPQRSRFQMYARNEESVL